jgi:hypothetical protein
MSRGRCHPPLFSPCTRNEFHLNCPIPTVIVDHLGPHFLSDSIGMCGRKENRAHRTNERPKPQTRHDAPQGPGEQRCRGLGKRFDVRHAWPSDFNLGRRPGSCTGNEGLEVRFGRAGRIRSQNHESAPPCSIGTVRKADVPKIRSGDDRYPVSRRFLRTAPPREEAVQRHHGSPRGLRERQR